ncbi:MAG: nicotinamide riboside transporter PnuC [Treponema sp.]|nr:nicotinamide riboside transporter PnuC [Treponema sp.]
MSVKNKLGMFIPSFSLLEFFLWIGSLSFISIMFAFLPEKDLFTLFATLTGVTSLIFVAKGNVIGHFIGLVFDVIYAIVSFKFRYYGEMITYMGMAAPASLVASVIWLKNLNGKEKAVVRMEHMTVNKFILATVLTILVTIAFYFILGAFNTKNLTISTFSVTTSFFAALFSIMRLPYYAIAYSANDIVLIIMWIMASKENPGYIPMIFCFVIFLANDIYGYLNWKKIRAEQEAKAVASVAV